MIFDDNYLIDFKQHEKEGDLVVTVSSSKGLLFYTSDFGRPTLFIVDNSFLYYTRRPDVLAAGLVAFMRDRGYRRAVLVGFSKGGFGALLLTKLCAKIAPDRSFGALVFSPQVRLWPRDTPLSFPSYHRLIKVAESDERVMEYLVKFGCIGSFNERNVAIETYWGIDNKQDRTECEFLIGRKVNKKFVPTSSHMAHLPYMVDTTDKAALRWILDRAYSQSVKIEGEDPSIVSQRTFDELSRIPKQKHIVELVSDLFGRLPWSRSQAVPWRGGWISRLSMAANSLRAARISNPE